MQGEPFPKNFFLFMLLLKIHSKPWNHLNTPTHQCKNPSCLDMRGGNSTTEPIVGHGCGEVRNETQKDTCLSTHCNCAAHTELLLHNRWKSNL